MRRSKQPETATSTASAAPSLTPAALPRARATSDAQDVPGLDDLERGRTAALIAALGRVQLTLDLIERRLGRLEETVASLGTGIADVPAQTLLLLEVVAPLDGLAEADQEAFVEELPQDVPADELPAEETRSEESESAGPESHPGETTADSTGLTG